MSHCFRDTRHQHPIFRALSPVPFPRLFSVTIKCSVSWGAFNLELPKREKWKSHSFIAISLLISSMSQWCMTKLKQCYQHKSNWCYLGDFCTTLSMKMLFHNKNPKHSQKMESSCTQGNKNRSILVISSWAQQISDLCFVFLQLSCFKKPGPTF